MAYSGEFWGNPSSSESIRRTYVFFPDVLFGGSSRSYLLRRDDWGGGGGDLSCSLGGLPDGFYFYKERGGVSEIWRIPPVPVGA